MLGEPLVSWLFFVFAVVLWLLVPVVAWLDRRADEADRDAWAAMFEDDTHRRFGGLW